MNINIKATNTTLTDAIRQNVEKKFVTLVKFLRPEQKIRVEVEFDKKRNNEPKFRAEVNIQPSGLYAEARSEDLYSAIDIVLPKIKEQLTKLKEKNLSKRRLQRKFSK